MGCLSRRLSLSARAALVLVLAESNEKLPSNAPMNPLSAHCYVNQYSREPYLPEASISSVGSVAPSAGPESQLSVHAGSLVTTAELEIPNSTFGLLVWSLL